jgi:hypothetical protein
MRFVQGAPLKVRQVGVSLAFPHAGTKHLKGAPAIAIRDLIIGMFEAKHCDTPLTGRQVETMRERVLDDGTRLLEVVKGTYKLPGNSDNLWKEGGPKRSVMLARWPVSKITEACTVDEKIQLHDMVDRLYFGVRNSKKDKKKVRELYLILLDDSDVETDLRVFVMALCDRKVEKERIHARRESDAAGLVDTEKMDILGPDAGTILLSIFVICQQRPPCVAC